MEMSARRGSTSRTIGVILLIVGIVWLLHEHGGFLTGTPLGEIVTVLVGLYLLWRWYAARQAGEAASPWVLGLGVALVIAGAQQLMGMTPRALSILVLIVGLAYLLDKRSPD